MKTIIEWFRRTKRFGGAFHEEWNQRRVQFEQLGGYYDMTEEDILQFICLSLRTGADMFFDAFTCSRSETY